MWMRWNNPRGEVEFDRVEFGYVPGQPVLRSASFQVEPGEFVAIAGSSGSGKSTLLNWVPRFYDVTGGAVIVDGCDVRDLRLGALRKPIGFVGQDNY